MPGRLPPAGAGQQSPARAPTPPTSDAPPPPPPVRREVGVDTEDLLAFGLELYRFVVFELDRNPVLPAGYVATASAARGAAMVTRRLEAIAPGTLERVRRGMVDVIDPELL